MLWYCCKNSTDQPGMDSVRPLKVPCGIWHLDVSSRSPVNCEAESLQDLLLHITPNRLSSGSLPKETLLKVLNG